MAVLVVLLFCFIVPAVTVGAVTFTASGVAFAATENQALTRLVAAFSHSDTALTASNFTASINWGDGSTASTGTVSGASGSFAVTGSHIFAEESPAGASFAMTVTIHDTANGLDRTADSFATVADAALSPGGPITPGTPQTFSGVGGTNTSITVGTANAALNAFETAIGGVKNTAAAPQSSGFRTITWDGVALDGTDFGGNTSVIVSNKVVGIPVNRFETQGAIFEEVYAVSGPASPTDTSTFSSVNPNVANLFPAFSPTKTFAMFNENTIGMSFAPAAPANVTATPAATRGFGCIFRNVRLPSTTSIEYFNGSQSLGKFFAPTSNTAGTAEFLGVLFANPIVTRVEIVCGTDVIFSFDGTTHSSNSIDDPATQRNLVVTDDFAYAEPVPAVAITGQTPIAAAAGTPILGIFGVFNDADPNVATTDFTSTIDFGDGSSAPGVITTGSGGGFNVTATHTFKTGGVFPIVINVQDFGGSALTIDNTAVVTGTPKAIIVTGADKGSEPRVRVFDDATGAKIFDFLAFEQKFKGGVRVATGDVNGDGIPDIIVARGPGGKPEVKVFDGKDGTAFPAPLGSFFAYDAKFTGGVFVAAGDFNGDGMADIVTAPGPGAAVKSDIITPPGAGAAPQVKVFSGADGSVLLHFFGEDPKFKKGLSVAVGDFNADGSPDIVTGCGPGGPPFVNVFDGKTGLPLPLNGFPLGTFAAFDPKFKGGVFVAAGDLDGDGKAEIIVGAGPGGGPHVRVFDGATTTMTHDFLAYTAGFKGGVRVAVGDLNGDGKADIITGTGKGGGALVNSFDGRSLLGLEFLFASDTGLPGGIFVAGSR